MPTKRTIIRRAGVNIGGLAGARDDVDIIPRPSVRSERRGRRMGSVIRMSSRDEEKEET